MHAFLILNFNGDINSLPVHISKPEINTVLEFPGSSVAQVRELHRFTSLSIPKPTIIYIPNIDKASREAQNALLKSLEEPQPNLYFVLTANNKQAVADTILSRCKVVSLASQKLDTTNSKALAEKFLKSSPGGKILAINKIKNRDESQVFLNQLLLGTHQLLLQSPDLADDLAHIESALEAIRGNGNVHLQLTNMVVSLKETSVVIPH
jgi:DNA polymerase-3 subunit delta'